MNSAIHTTRPLGEAVCFSVDCPDLQASFAALLDRGRCVYRRAEDEEMLALGVAVEVSADSFAGSFARMRRVLDSFDPASREELRIVAWSAFSPDARRCDDELPSWQSFPRRTLYLPEVVIRRSAGETRATVVAVDAALEGIWQRWADALARPGEPSGRHSRSFETTWLDEERFSAGVAHVVGSEDASKVVLARRALVEADAPIDLLGVMRALGQRYPSCSLFAIGADEDSPYPVFVGATPERLARVDGDTVDTMALAGTTRGDHGSEQADRALMRSRKDRREHRFVVDMIASALSPLCTSVDVADEPRVHRLANVSHLLTDIAGELREGVGLAEVADALHPTPAVCGTPRETAAFMIRELEGYDRGLYAGVFGWMDADGNGVLDVALRCGLIEAQRALLFAGAGITDESDVDIEVAETRRKFAPLLDAIDEVSS